MYCLYGFSSKPRTESSNLRIPTIWSDLTVHLLVADVLQAFPHPLHLVAQLVLLLQRVHPLFQVHLITHNLEVAVKVEEIGKGCWIFNIYLKVKLMFLMVEKGSSKMF